MKQIYYNVEDRWKDYWRTVREDSAELDKGSYPLFPAINYLERDGLILEAGCGLGRLAKWMEKDGFKVVAMELEEYSISKLKSDSPSMKCVRADASRLPFSDGKFKHIFLMGVIDVFTEDSKRELALKDAKRVLDKEGTAFISVPHQDSLFWFLYTLRRNNFIRLLFGKPRLQQHFGQMAFSAGEIDLLMKKHFESFTINYVNCKMSFFYIFPFLRSKKARNKKFSDMQKEERNCGDKVYELNKIGDFLFASLRNTSLFKKLISPTLYVVAKK